VQILRNVLRRNLFFFLLRLLDLIVELIVELSFNNLWLISPQTSPLRNDHPIVLQDSLINLEFMLAERMKLTYFEDL